MNEKFNKNAKVEKFTNMPGIAVRLIVISLGSYGITFRFFSKIQTKPEFALKVINLNFII